MFTDVKMQLQGGGGRSAARSRREAQELQEQLALLLLSGCLCLLMETCSAELQVQKETVQSTGGKEAIFMFFRWKRTLNKRSFKCSLFKYPFTS